MKSRPYARLRYPALAVTVQTLTDLCGRRETAHLRRLLRDDHEALAWCVAMIRQERAAA